MIKTKAYTRLIGYLKRYWLDFSLGVLGTVCASGIASAFLWFLKPLLNKGFIRPDHSFIRWAPLIVILAYSLLGCACFIGDYFIARAARQVVRDLQRVVFDKFLVLPFSYLNNRSPGNLLSLLIYNIDQVAEAVSDALLTIIKDGSYLIGLLVVMFLNSWQLTLIFLISVPVVCVIVAITAKRLKRLSLNVQDSVGLISHVAKETLEGEAIVRSFAGEDYEQNKMRKATQRLFHRQVKIVVTNSIGMSLSRIVPSIVVAFSIYLATSPHSLLSAGAFVSTIAAMFAVFKPLKNLMNINSVLQRGMAGAESVFEVLDTPAEDDKGIRQLQSAKGKVEFQSVRFTYPGREKPVFANFSFLIEPGQKILLAGPSGSGKTTIINLLSRFYEVDQGKILLDDVDIKEIKLANLRSQFSLVSERISLFNDTIARNIAYGCLERVSEEKIYQAAEAACLLSWIQELPLKMDTVIGNDGVLVSAGQRQRIALARAILKDAPILILDEATSVVDLQTEQCVQEALEQLSKNKTMITITHRPHAHYAADQVIALE